MASIIYLTLRFRYVFRRFDIIFPFVYVYVCIRICKVKLGYIKIFFDVLLCDKVTTNCKRTVDVKNMT